MRRENERQWKKKNHSLRSHEEEKEREREREREQWLKKKMKH